MLLLKFKHYIYNILYTLIFNLKLKSYISIKQELVKFLLVNQKEDNALLEFLANVTTSADYDTLKFSLKKGLTSISKITEPKDIVAKFLYTCILKIILLELSRRTFFLDTLFMKNKKCKKCKSTNEVLIIYLTNSVCSACGSVL